jgi:hypothetical protein
MSEENMPLPPSRRGGKGDLADFDFMFIPYPEYSMAVKKWGERSQIAIAIAELCELQRAIAKYYQAGDRFNKSNLIEEMADGIIVLGQVRVVFGVDVKFRQARYDPYKAGEHISDLTTLLYKYYDGNIQTGKLRKKIAKAYSSMASVMQTFQCRQQVRAEFESRVENLADRIREN